MSTLLTGHPGVSLLSPFFEQLSVRWASAMNLSGRTIALPNTSELAFAALAEQFPVYS